MSKTCLQGALTGPRFLESRVLHGVRRCGSLEAAVVLVCDVGLCVAEGLHYLGKRGAVDRVVCKVLLKLWGCFQPNILQHDKHV